MKRQRTASFQNATETLLTHLSTIGASYPKLSFHKTITSGMTAIAKSAIDSGEIIFTLPKTSLITSSKINQSLLGKSLSHHLQHNAIVSNELILCLYLILAQRTTDHPFHLYAKSLSKIPPDTTHWPIHIQSRVRGTVASATNKALFELQQWYTFCSTTGNLQVSPFDLEKPTMEELKWARGHVVSRRFPENPSSTSTSTSTSTSSTSTSDYTYSMLPGMDLLNHSNDVQMEWKVDEIGTVRFQTMTAVQEGEECLNNYGSKSNTQLLFMHGFALPNNPYDVVELSLKTQDSNGNVSILWQDSFYGNETEIPFAMLENFLDDNVDNETERIISSEVVLYCLDWIQTYLTPLEEYQQEELRILNMNQEDKKEIDSRLLWIAIHHASQRKILLHIQSLLNKLLQ